MYLWIGMMKNLLLRKYIYHVIKIVLFKKNGLVFLISCKKMINFSFVFQIAIIPKLKVVHIAATYNYIQPRLYYIESNGGNKRRFQVDEVGFRSPAFARGERLRPGLGQGIIILQYIWVSEGFTERLLLFKTNPHHQIDFYWYIVSFFILLLYKFF